MMNSPLVSVSCLTFNHSSFIKQCFDGILSQKTDFPFEIVVYDDASTDGTDKIILEYTEKFPNRFNVLIQKENQYSQGVRGIAAKFNFPRCRGKYIAFCEGDDFWTDPLKLQKQVDFLEENPDYSICCTNYSEVDQFGGLVRENIWNGIRLAPVISHETILEHYKPKILTSIFRKDVFGKGFPDIFFKTFNSDNFLCAIATENGPAAFLNFNSGCYRIHNQGVWSGKTEINQYEMQLDTYQKMQGHFTKDSQKKAISNRIYKIRRKLSRLYAKELHFGKSMVQMKYMFAFDPKDSSKVLLGNLIAPFRKAFQ
jgi:glycosyltransferase involved in cell wall biosynthesis